MAVTQQANIAALVSPIVQEALFTASEQSIMRGLVKNYNVPMNSGKSAQVPVYPTVSAVAVSEGTDLASSNGDITVSTTTAEITLGEVGVMTNLTDFAKNTSEQNVVSHLGRLFGEAIAKKIDTDLIALFSGFSTSKGPGAGQELTIASMFSAAAELRTNAAPGPYFGVFHPKQIFAVKSALTNTFNGANNLPDLGNEALRAGYVGEIAGIRIFESSNVSVDGSGDATGGIFAMDALGLAMMEDMRIEVQRDASLRADEIVATATYGVKELIDSYGMKMISDATI